MKLFYQDLIHHLKQIKGIVAIDGRCGSGKTELARFLQRELGCPVIHMDDYYTPIYQRPENWMDIPFANMDIERIEKEVLIPAFENREGKTRSYSHHVDAYSQWEAFVMKDLLLLEGSYSLHPDLRKYYADTVFLTCSKQVQFERLLKREQDNIVDFENFWIPMEEKYFKEYQVESYAHWKYNTDTLMKEEQR